MKDKLGKYLTIGVIAIALVVIINKLIKKNEKSVDSEDFAKLDLDKVLSKGSSGDEVFELQRILKNQYEADLGFTGFDKDGIEGEFGSMTEKALLDAKGVKEISLRQILINK
jgi:hypothetical protein